MIFGLNGCLGYKRSTEVLKEVEERIAQWTMVDSGQGEGIQVLDYKVGQPMLLFSKLRYIIFGIL